MRIYRDSFSAIVFKIILVIITLSFCENVAGELCALTQPCIKSCGNVQDSVSCTSATCSKFKGSCLYACDSKDLLKCGKCLRNRQNRRCDQLCSSLCVDTSCNSSSDRICAECMPGYYGPTCQQACSDACSGSCFRDIGYCKICPPGKYGRRCETKCPSYCRRHNCSTETAACLECNEGYTGKKCEVMCSQGFYGMSCDHRCPENCDGDTCDPMTGLCHFGCKSGFYGGRCQRRCPDGTYGSSCLSLCPVTCANTSSCHHVNGSCLDGCAAGFQGDHCDVVCTLGTYGENCVYNCSAHCFLGMCNAFSGHCERCIDGRDGRFCENSSRSVSSYQHEAEITIKQTIVMFLGLVVTGLGFWYLLGVLLYYRRKFTTLQASKTGKAPSNRSSGFRHYPRFYFMPKTRRASYVEMLRTENKRARRPRGNKKARKLRRPRRRMPRTHYQRIRGSTESIPSIWDETIDSVGVTEDAPTKTETALVVDIADKTQTEVITHYMVSRESAGETEGLVTDKMSTKECGTQTELPDTEFVERAEDTTSSTRETAVIAKSKEPVHTVTTETSSDIFSMAKISGPKESIGTVADSAGMARRSDSKEVSESVSDTFVITKKGDTVEIPDTVSNISSTIKKSKRKKLTEIVSKAFGMLKKGELLKSRETVPDASSITTNNKPTEITETVSGTSVTTKTSETKTATRIVSPKECIDTASNISSKKYEPKEAIEIVSDTLGMVNKSETTVCSVCGAQRPRKPRSRLSQTRYHDIKEDIENATGIPENADVIADIIGEKIADKNGDEFTGTVTGVDPNVEDDNTLARAGTEKTEKTSRGGSDRTNIKMIVETDTAAGNTLSNTQQDTEMLPNTLASTQESKGESTPYPICSREDERCLCSIKANQGSYVTTSLSLPTLFVPDSREVSTLPKRNKHERPTSIISDIEDPKFKIDVSNFEECRKPQRKNSMEGESLDSFREERLEKVKQVPKLLRATTRVRDLQTSRTSTSTRTSVTSDNKISATESTDQVTISTSESDTETNTIVSSSAESSTETSSTNASCSFESELETSAATQLDQETEEITRDEEVSKPTISVSYRKDPEYSSGRTSIDTDTSMGSSWLYKTSTSGTLKRENLRVVQFKDSRNNTIEDGDLSLPTSGTSLSQPVWKHSRATSPRPPGLIQRGFRNLLRFLNRLMRPVMPSRKKSLQGPVRIVYDQPPLPQKRHASYQFLLSRLDNWRRSGGQIYTPEDGVTEIADEKATEMTYSSESTETPSRLRTIKKKKGTVKHSVPSESGGDSSTTSKQLVLQSLTEESEIDNSSSATSGRRSSSTRKRHSATEASERKSSALTVSQVSSPTTAESSTERSASTFTEGKDSKSINVTSNETPLESRSTSQNAYPTPTRFRDITEYGSFREMHEAIWMAQTSPTTTYSWRGGSAITPSKPFSGPNKPTVTSPAETPISSQPANSTLVYPMEPPKEYDPILMAQASHITTHPWRGGSAYTPSKPFPNTNKPTLKSLTETQKSPQSANSNLLYHLKPSKEYDAILMAQASHITTHP